MKIGCDVVFIPRFEKILNNQIFMDKVFHPDEIEYCLKKGVKKLDSFAGRFAVKEAFAKALGSGILTHFGLNEVWTVSDDQGKPSLYYSAKVKDFLEREGLSPEDISISHDGDYAFAVVLLKTIKS